MEAANEAAAAVARKKILQAANDARVAAEKEAKEAAEEEEARASEKETKRMLEKFKQDQERMAQDKENEKDRQRILLKKKIQKRKEIAKRRKEAEKKSLENQKKELEALEGVHKNQRDELKVHHGDGEKEVGGGGGGGGVGGTDPVELEKAKEELHLKEVALLESQGIVDGLKGDLDLLKVELDHKEDENNSVVEKMAGENMAVRKKLEEVLKELQGAKEKINSSETVPVAEFEEVKQAMEIAFKAQGEAEARLKESISTREFLEGEIKEGESHVEELHEVIQGLEGKVVELGKEHEEEMDNVGAEKEEVQKVADRVVDAEEKSKLNQEKRDFFEARFNEVLKQKKKLHNNLLDLGGKIRVYARIRPISEKEIGNNEREACLYVNEQALSLEANYGSGEDTAEGRDVREFEYDSVFGPRGR